MTVAGACRCARVVRVTYLLSQVCDAWHQERGVDARAGEQLGAEGEEDEGEGEDDGGYGSLEGQEWVDGDAEQEQAWYGEEPQRDDGLLEQ